MPRVEKPRSTVSRADPIARPSGQVATVTSRGPHHEAHPEPGSLTSHMKSDEIDEDDEFEPDGDEDAKNATPVRVAGASAMPTVPRPDQDTVGYLFRVMIRTMGPPNIVRILRVPSTATFHQLHLILQSAFEWHNYHLYNFEVNTVPQKGQPKRQYDELDIRYDPNEVMRLEERPQDFDFLSPDKLKVKRDVKLWQIFENETWTAKGVVVEYTYDLGDNWNHILHFMGRADGMLGDAMGKLDQPAFCVAGEGRPCEEDSGSFPTHDVWKWDIVKINKELRQLCRLKAFKG